jgi:tRNA(Ile)-lysidine synthase
MSFSAAALRAVLETHLPDGVTGLVVGLSGGADSAALLIAAAGMRASLRASLRAVHIDHGLQAAAVSFRESCVALCGRLGVPLTVIPVVVPLPPGASLEAAARDARYAALAAEIEAGECLLTAHHREDQAETLLLQALRGAGLPGLSAMPRCRPFGRGWHLRPLLEVPQAELKAFAARFSARASPDPMNEDLRFDRSYLRARVWPLLEERWPGSAASLARAARHAADAQELLDAAAASTVGRLRDGSALSVPGLRALAPQERVHVLRFWICEAGAEPPPAARLSEALRQMLDARLDHLPVVAWGNHALRRYRQRLFLTQAEPPRLEGVRRWQVQSGAGLELGPGLGVLRWAAQDGGLDPLRLPPTVTVRGRSGGETLKPAAHSRTQSVQHLCQAHGLLPWLRDALPLLFAEDALMAVGDLWLDARGCVPAGVPGLGIVWEGAPILV